MTQIKTFLSSYTSESSHHHSFLCDFLDNGISHDLVGSHWLPPQCAPAHIYEKYGLMDKIQAKKLHKPLFYLPLQAFEKMNKKSAFTVVVK